jgi:CO/xanthine dehydrogenase Mo-binding subunit
MDGAAPAIAAAIFNATGAFVTEIPITPERLMAAIDNTYRPRAIDNTEQQ